jgi:5-methyltetrahydrofolate--homocysteine methyltransferase
MEPAMTDQPGRQSRISDLEQALKDRILVLDGAMGSTIQGYGLSEEDFRGEHFKDHPSDLKGDNELLSLTRPDVIREIHDLFFESGADIAATNTFGSNAISQSDYSLERTVRELNLASANIAREAADVWTAKDPSKPRFVAGAVGPTPKTLSLSPDVNDPAARSLTFVELANAYREQVEALIEGGVDILLVETIFDTLNAKAALVAIDEAFEATGTRLPIMISVAITDASGRTLSGHGGRQLFARRKRNATPCRRACTHREMLCLELSERRTSQCLWRLRRGAGDDGRARRRVRDERSR